MSEEMDSIDEFCILQNRLEMNQIAKTRLDMDILRKEKNLKGVQWFRSHLETNLLTRQLALLKEESKILEQLIDIGKTRLGQNTDKENG